MIEISLGTAMLVYSLILLAGATMLWLYMEVKEQRRHFEVKNQFIWRCAICTYVYLDDEAEKFSSCPRCHTLNSIQDANAKAVLPRHLEPETPVEKDPEDQPRRNASKQKRRGTSRRGPRRRSR
ncbi:MAG: hypothetical protein HYV27_10185 [Candidatus Hydrogenedentes bacterium]|nr:hypothetical protein [Candidatus Hydrogenedentota bacterium]